MRGKLYISVFGLVVALSSAGIDAADAAKKRPLGASPSREQLFMYCRQRVFVKYGHHGWLGKYWLQGDMAARRIEYCVASGGKSI